MTSKKYLLSLFAAIIVAATGYSLAHALPYAPGQTLDPSCNPGDANCTVSATSTTLQNLNIQAAAGAANLFDVASSSGSSFLHVTSVGNIGISTTTPANKLTIIGVTQSTGGFTTNGTITAVLGGNNLTASGTIPFENGTAGILGQDTSFCHSLGVAPSLGILMIGVNGCSDVMDGGNDGGILLAGDINSDATLEIHNSYAEGVSDYSHSNTAFRGATLTDYRSDGTRSSPTAVLSGSVLGNISFDGYTGSTYTNGAEIYADTSENFDLTHHASYLGFVANADGTSGQMNLSANGLLIGNGNSPAVNALDVEGGTAIGSYAGSNTAPANGLIVSGSTGFGTTTPLANFQITNNTSNATTTMEIGKSGQNKGTCLKLYRSDGSAIYASVAAGATTFTLSTTACASVSGF
jgi:hypothetical protein